jgi:ATP-dependent DNA helicase PIF1
VTFILIVVVGAGKTVLLGTVIKTLRLKYDAEGVNPDTVAVTAMTGITALVVGGTTLHAWAGIRLGTGTVDELFDMVIRNKAARERWRQCKCLIVDESR